MEEESFESNADSALIIESSANELFWRAPVSRSDNSSLSRSEISGYRIYYGMKQGDYLNRIEITDGAAETYVFTDLSSGIYYVVVTVFDTEGRESLYSNELVVIV